jgi:hypothetical protein
MTARNAEIKRRNDQEKTTMQQSRIPIVIAIVVLAAALLVCGGGDVAGTLVWDQPLDAAGRLTCTPGYRLTVDTAGRPFCQETRR